MILLSSSLPLSSLQRKQHTFRVALAQQQQQQPSLFLVTAIIFVLFLTSTTLTTVTAFAIPTTTSISFSYPTTTHNNNKNYRNMRRMIMLRTHTAAFPSPTIQNHRPFLAATSIITSRKSHCVSRRTTFLKSSIQDDTNTNNNTNNATGTQKAFVESLLGNVMGRAARTLSYDATTATTTTTNKDNDNPSSQSNNNNGNDNELKNRKKKKQHQQQKQKKKKKNDISNGTPYLDNPAITLTALAKEQWSHIIRPNIDTVIDATCGNGYDSLAIAKMLFPPSTTNNHQQEEDNSNTHNTTKSQAKLICIDIQPQACDATKQKLQTYFNHDNDMMDQYVEIRTTSHSPLFPSLSSSSLSEEDRTHDKNNDNNNNNHNNNKNIGLVCYNLGYLPSNTNTPSSPKKDDHDETTTATPYTQVSSTISSIADAALSLRLGGMLSIVTYPRTNPNEDYAVHAMLEGLGLLSSKTIDWRQFIQDLGPDLQVSYGTTNSDNTAGGAGTVKISHIAYNTTTTADSDGPDGKYEDNKAVSASLLSYSVRDTVMQALERIVEEGPNKQTWRVMEHKQMGRPLSPIFLTAIRIK